MDKKYIEQKAAIKAVEKNDCEGYATWAIKSVPIADVRPMVRGEWVGYPECLKYSNAYSDDHIVCSVCEECFSILDNDCERFNFCPNCGSDNRGDNDDT